MRDAERRQRIEDRLDYGLRRRYAAGLARALDTERVYHRWQLPRPPRYGKSADQVAPPHRITGVAAVYNRFQYLEERKAALDALSSFIASLIGRDPDNLVRFAAVGLTSLLFRATLSGKGILGISRRTEPRVK